MALDIQSTIEAVWRIESPRLIAGLARMVRDVGVAEDLAQDALVSALEQWPESGVPDKGLFGNFSRKSNISQILNQLKDQGIHCTREGNVITVMH